VNTHPSYPKRNKKLKTAIFNKLNPGIDG